MTDLAPIDDIMVNVYRIPTETPESDGTLAWDHTTMVLTRIAAGGKRGIGFSYTHESAAHLIHGLFRSLLEGENALDIPALWNSMAGQVRNIGRPGVAASAISSVDAALWDLKARLYDTPLATLLGKGRNSVPVYGSGGFTSYSLIELEEQLSGWVDEGIRQVKMKIGSEPRKDQERVKVARRAIGADADLFVDANGAYTVKEALIQAERFNDYQVSWFEEPVSSDDLEGLSFLRDRCPARINIAAGEYGYDIYYFKRMLEARSVDVLQGDATRCMGITGFLKAGALCESFQIPFSAHTAPSIHLHPCMAMNIVEHIEYFYDHVRIEQEFFEGAAKHKNGALYIDEGKPGLGLTLKEADVKRYKI